MEKQSPASRIHSQAIVTDAHSDYALAALVQYRKGNEKAFRNEHLPRLRLGGARLEVNTVGGDFDMGGVDFRNPLNVFGVLDRVHHELERAPGELVLVRTGADLDALEKDRNKIGLLLALEGAAPIDSDFALLHNYYRLGLRAVALTHNERNIFAEGCREDANGGLSRLGKQLLQELNRLNIMLDLVHVGERTFFDALELFAKVPYVSHSNVKALCNHFRNLTDAQIKAVAGRGGVVGMNFIADFVDSDHSKATVERMVDHIAYIADLVGIDHVGLGPDFIDYDSTIKEWLVQHNLPPEGADFAHGIEDVTCLPHITETMVARGFSDQDIQKVLGENFIHVYRRNLAAR